MSESGEEMGVEEARQRLTHHHEARCMQCPGTEVTRNRDVERFERAIRSSERAAVLAEVEEAVADLIEEGPYDAIYTFPVGDLIARIRNGGTQ